MKGLWLTPAWQEYHVLFNDITYVSKYTALVNFEAFMCLKKNLRRLHLRYKKNLQKCSLVKIISLNKTCEHHKRVFATEYIF